MRPGTIHPRSALPARARRPARAAAVLVLAMPLLVAGAHAEEARGAARSGPAALFKGGKGKRSGKKKKKEKKKKPDRVIVWLRVGKVVKGGVKVTVQPFQRLQDIAETYGISVKAILEANSHVSANVIKAGQKIFIPGASDVKAVKTFVPAGEIDKLEGLGIQLDDVPGAGGGGGGGASSHGMQLIKSGKVTSKGVKHTVQKGQTLFIIAQAYGVDADEIIAANGLKNEDLIRPGQRLLIPDVKKVVPVPGIESDEADAGDDEGIKSGKKVKAGVLHTILPGQTLWDISKAYHTKVDSILKANGLKNQDKIKSGQKILIPGAEEVAAVPCSSKGKLVYVHPVTFHRIHTGETRSLNLFTPSGKINWKDYKVLRKMMYDQRTGKTHKIHTRLILLIGDVAEHFGFKTIIIYSGYRAPEKDQPKTESKHNVGRAIDFAVEGVSNWKLMKYCRTFSGVGVGYYPNSYFVHLDVRDKDAFWVDYSKPGQKPKYQKMETDLEKKARAGSIPPK